MEQIFTNARIVTADAVVQGTLCLRDDRIVDVSSGPSQVPGAVDWGGDLLLPGLVELHTDNLEKHMTPRPKTEWPSLAAIVAHDNHIASAGITTVFDAISIGDLRDDSTRVTRLRDMVGGLHQAMRDNILRADHFIHLRCEVSYPGMQDNLDQLCDHDLVRMFSVTDHTPGQRQFVCLDAYRTYYQGKYGLNDTEIEDFMQKRRTDQERYSAKHRRSVVETAHRKGLILASHDDATEDNVAEALRDQMVVAEFPTTARAAQLSHAGGMAVMMGGPNIVRGGSHSGNIAAADLARDGVLDILSSDYYPHSLIHAAILLHRDHGHSLPAAISTVTKTPADRAGLGDRGEIALHRRADVIRVNDAAAHPVVTGVWRAGVRVA